MKRGVFLAVVVLVALAVTVGAQTNNFIFATGSTSGTYFPFGGAMAQIFNSRIRGMNVTVQTTGASRENLILISKGEVELAIVQNDNMEYASKGIETFAGQRLSGFSTIATLYPETVQIVVSPDSGIRTVADMKGKRISVGAAGSGVEANAKQVLEAYGLTFNDLRSVRLNFSESASAYRDKQIDGFFVTAGVPNPAIQDIATLGSVRLVSIDAAAAKRLMDRYPFYTPFTITKDTYKGMTEDAQTLAMRATLICRTSLPADVVYQLTKTLFDNLGDLGRAHAKGREVSLSEAVKGSPIPFHPGAERYFREMGVLK